MSRRIGRRAFTLIELLVVVAIIGLLISILLPSLQGAREQAKKARCLANLKSIGLGCHTYASEHPKEVVSPVHHQVSHKTAGFTSMWWWRTVDWFTWGGRSAPETFLVGGAIGWELGDVPLVAGQPPQFAAQTRPLNRILFDPTTLAPTYDASGNPIKAGSSYNVAVFQCPSDRGYPDAPATIIDDSPPANAARPCYDTLGNSYRASMATWGGGSHMLSRSVWGHRLSSLPDAGLMILAGEPTFFNMIKLDSGPSEPIPDPIILTGWHKKFMEDNLLYVDGSARTTRAYGFQSIDPTLEKALGVGNLLLTGRGPKWRITSEPTPGSRLRGNMAVFVGQLGVDANEWPLKGIQDNLH